MTGIDVVHTVDELRHVVDRAARAGLRVGLVPTMGALHDGHASLVARAAADNDVVIATVFVNPLQFAPTEDLSAYPRTLAADVAHQVDPDHVKAAMPWLPTSSCVLTTVQLTCLLRRTTRCTRGRCIRP